MRLRKDIKKKWLQALRSGKYEQGFTRLRTGSEENYNESAFCCLGVLADLLDPEGWQMNYSPDCSSGPDCGPDCRGYYWHDACEVLPDEKSLPLGLSPSAQTDLAQLNDEGNDFEYIANWIDENL